VEFRGPVNSETERRVFERVRALAGSSSQVHFAPAVAPKEMAAVLRRYDAICCPSLCVEGGPTVALEALAVGTPVIGSRIGGLAELIQDGVNGRLLRPGDVGELAHALRDLAERPEQLQAWRAHLPTARSLADVTGDYLRLYAA
jgi:glycosyltransferase involved in cell wall biosynthesis